MGVFDRQIATAQRLIKKYGEQVIWQSAPDSEDNGQPWNPEPVEPVDHRVVVAFFPTNSSIGQLIRMMRNSDVPTGNELGYMAQVSGFVPSSLDTIVRKSGAVYRIKNIDPLDPNGEGVILYTLEFQE